MNVLQRAHRKENNEFIIWTKTKMKFNKNWLNIRQDFYQYHRNKLMINRPQNRNSQRLKSTYRILQKRLA